ncbi:5-dehydro-4-deoxyglucarate dehydratase [Allostreptomyces psammosilenae]|uniref:Probable 5-dehydro-4-deoxyglucarate dehydratase n=1 Tax=Allostreptomyces psammosilenae TaxID=1892865 RepID=A0A852ZX42_9ACTN|nr:5-dehydro-4-deoxyglucarate dehydratase [Allostreptomyces psammosilenae]NYI03201.1 5-dehydro-4-deoxyglucarate dehydratase [Allostreptomyces psammosilenae]
MKLNGVLFFPLTPFTPDGQVATDVLATHIAGGLEHGPGGVFVACGTGEFHSLSTAEHAAAVRTAVATTAGRVPVLAGAGGPLGAALEQAANAREAGADGLLLMPPYVAKSPTEGFAAYVRAVAEQGLPVVLYQRDGVVLDPATAVDLARIPGVVGLKDGNGDIDRMHRVVLAIRREIGEGFAFFNGLPTAELTVPAYRGIGVDLYSSAAFCFAPEVATAFHRALTGGDQDVVGRLLSEFYGPLVELRSRVPGYAVSLVKAGARLRGLEVGPVRAPLVEPSAEDLKELARIIDTGLALVGAEARVEGGV